MYTPELGRLALVERRARHAIFCPARMDGGDATVRQVNVTGYAL
jgi:hypothetical protein